MNGFNAFERTVKESLEPYEVPYNSADWAQMERMMDQGKVTDRVARSGLYALLLGGSIAAASSLYVLITPASATGELVGTAKIDMTVPSVPSTSAAPLLIIEIPSESPLAQVPTQEASLPVPPSGTAPAPKSSGRVPVALVETFPAKDVVRKTDDGPVVLPSITEGCPGTLIEFAAQNLPEKGIYLWNFGDGSFSNKPTPNHAFSKSGSFEVMLSHSSPGGGSIHNKPAADRIVIHEAPEASFNLLKQEYDNTVPSVHFENRSLRGSSYIWDFGDGATSTIAHPDHVYKKEGMYQVSLTVTNANGCVDRTERTVRIDSDYDLLAPKTFSPNADGVDDVFMPEALKTLGVKFHMSIFDSKSGELVYETSDAQRPWNGRISNRGEACVSGDYVWMVEMRDGEKLGGTYNGAIDLVR